MKYVQENGLSQPIVFRNPSGLGMRLVLYVVTGPAYLERLPVVQRNSVILKLPLSYTLGFQLHINNCLPLQVSTAGKILLSGLSCIM